DPGLRQREEDEQDLEQQRRAPEERDVEAGEAVEVGVRRKTAQRADRGEDDRQGDRGERDEDRDRDPEQAERDPLGDERRGEADRQDDEREERRDDDQPGEDELRPPRPIAAPLRRLDLLGQGRDG